MLPRLRPGSGHKRMYSIEDAKHKGATDVGKEHAHHKKGSAERSWKETNKLADEQVKDARSLPTEAHVGHWPEQIISLS